VLNAYTLVFGGFLLLGGRLADRLGRRRLFMAGTALFAGASLICGVAQSEATLLAARSAQGLGGAMVSPAALSIILTTFAEGTERNRALAAVRSPALAHFGGSLTMTASTSRTAPTRLSASARSPIATSYTEQRVGRAGQRDGSQPALGSSDHGVSAGAAGRSGDQDAFDGHSSLSSVIGSSRIRLPVALKTAFATAAAAPVMPISPTPRAPSGECSSGMSV
jgi:Major Facilitator Superfamily